MAVSIFPPVSSGAAVGGGIQVRTILQVTLNVRAYISLQNTGGAGYYKFTYLSNDASFATSVTILEADAGLNQLVSHTLTGITATEQSYKFINTDASTSVFSVLANESGTLYIDKLATVSTPAPTVTSYSTSQNITLSNPARFALIGGGGGGSIAYTSTAIGGGGGGSGYRVTGSVLPGTYALVCGAGGGSQGTGGSSTFAGLTALGGNPGVGKNGGNGGSGGGGGGPGSGGWSTGSGGSNGSNGSGSNQPGYSSGGLGSGAPLPVYITPGAGGAGFANGGAGNAGGLYAGGGGGGTVTESTRTGQSSTAIGGGGGGGASWNDPGVGGSGGPGGLIILEGL